MVQFGSVFASLLTQQTPDQSTWRHREFRDHDPAIHRHVR